MSAAFVSGLNFQELARVAIQYVLLVTRNCWLNEMLADIVIERCNWVIVEQDLLSFRD